MAGRNHAPILAASESTCSPLKFNNLRGKPKKAEARWPRLPSSNSVAANYSPSSSVSTELFPRHITALAARCEQGLIDAIINGLGHETRLTIGETSVNAIDMGGRRTCKTWRIPHIGIHDQIENILLHSRATAIDLVLLEHVNHCLRGRLGLMGGGVERI